jgi:hypothetical protein
MDYNLMFRWFVGLGIDDPVWVPTVFTKNRDRLLSTEMSRKVMAAILAHREVAPLLSDDHFSVDGTLIKAWASMKSFQPKAETAPPDDDGPTRVMTQVGSCPICDRPVSRRMSRRNRDIQQSMAEPPGIRATASPRSTERRLKRRSAGPRPSAAWLRPCIAASIASGRGSY